ncbi:hypothetical protein MD484_g2550, partial [Candolleomyces efflorescens]
MRKEYRPEMRISLKRPGFGHAKLAKNAYGAFLAAAQIFLNKFNNYGIGEAIPIHPLHEQFDPALSFVWADNTNGASSPAPIDIINHITSSFSSAQLSAVKRVGSAAEIPTQCPQNFNLYSECFAAVAFFDIPSQGSSPVNYTIYSDAGLAYIDVVKHTSDFEKRILPLQWAIDKAIIELQTGVQLPTPLEWPYSQKTNDEQRTEVRLSYIRGIRELFVLALFICFLDVSYQLPGSFSGERASLITAHMKAMGLLDKARILSWHVSVSLTYLPAWIVVGLIWRYRIFAEANAGLVVIIHILLGLTLASWSFFVAAPFGKSPQLAAVVTTFLAIVLAVIALVFKSARNGAAFIFTILFPPGFYIFVTRAICGYENNRLPTNILKGDPDFGISVLPQLIAAVIDIFLWPYLAVLLERKLYDARCPNSKPWYLFWKKTAPTDIQPLADDVAISVRNLNKVYRTSRWSSKGAVTAVNDLSFDVPKTGILVLLGSNGAGKSTSLGIISGLDGPTGGQVVFEGGQTRPARGTIGIVPQKNVLFPELSCLQTLRVWKAVKWSKNSDSQEDLEQLLRDCDLGKKINANSSTLSGGQKRKLQLAIGLLGGSKIVLVDECTSGVDPLSRRALWRTLTSFRDDRAIVFTTHFLDEADLLADHIAILAAPGKLVASGSPVALKRDLGEGYSLQVTFGHADREKFDAAAHGELLAEIQRVAPETHTSSPAPHQIIYHLKEKDPKVVQQLLEFLEHDGGASNVKSYDILGTSVEDIFLDLMVKHNFAISPTKEKELEDPSKELATPGTEVDSTITLANGRPVSPFRQAFTIFYKRLLIAKRSWLTPILTVGIAIAGACIPLVFIAGKSQSCTTRLRAIQPVSIYLPNSPFTPIGVGPSARTLASPPGIINSLGLSTLLFGVTNVPDESGFVDTIRQNYLNLSAGGVSINTETNQALFAWEARPPGLMGTGMLNLASNILYNRALNATGASERTPVLIRANYAPLPTRAAGTLISLRWIVFFGAVMAVYPAFYALYVSRERKSAVQAMQLSNGLSDPVGLWLGHLMYDTITVLILTTIIVIIFAAVAGGNFHGLGFLWFNMVLYGIAAALFAYCISLAVKSPLAAFATVAVYQFIVFALYLCGYLLVLTYGKTTEANKLISIIHWTVSLVSPVCSVTRAALVSVNLFTLLCDDGLPATTGSMGQITKFGGPIVYLFATIFVLLAVLVWADSGSRTARRLRDIQQLKKEENKASHSKEDVFAAAEEASRSDDLLRILDVSKSYSGQRVVDDVSFSLPSDTVFALLGPNGAGKTTTFNMIRGDVIPDIGDILINGTSVVRHPKTARASLGVCPQFTAIDSQLTVREHLIIYGKLKGLNSQELDESVEIILRATALVTYADRLASKLSGGNQRKLSLAIALIGNPSVVLIDEFSSGVDPKMKRDMWLTLRKVSAGKAVILTTHSMEEASALANKVGILAKRLLAVGTIESLASRYATYEVHFTCRTREEIVHAQELMSRIPGAKKADDVATRFEVPIDSSEGFSLAKLFSMLSSDSGFTEYTVERGTLESVFLKVIRENDVKEEDSSDKKRYGC